MLMLIVGNGDALLIPSLFSLNLAEFFHCRYILIFIFRLSYCSMLLFDVLYNIFLVMGCCRAVFTIQTACRAVVGRSVLLILCLLSHSGNIFSAGLAEDFRHFLGIGYLECHVLRVQLKHRGPASRIGAVYRAHLVIAGLLRIIVGIDIAILGYSIQEDVLSTIGVIYLIRLRPFHRIPG